MLIIAALIVVAIVSWGLGWLMGAGSTHTDDDTPTCFRSIPEHDED